MPRRLLSTLALSGVVSACASPPPPACPEVDSEPRVPDLEPAPDPATPPSEPAPATTAGSIRAAEDFPIPSNCEAPLSITQEVTRLLVAAAAHGTRSRACVDGPGQRLAVNDVLVCPAPPQGDDVVVKVFYQVVTYPEGDTRGCGDARDCSWLTPTASDHLVDLHLRRGKDPARGTLVDPGPLPGFPDDATPLGDLHDGNCYGKSPAFVPAEITLGR